METCPKCGSKVDPKWGFCTLCNYKFGDNTVQSLRVGLNSQSQQTAQNSQKIEAKGINGQLALLADRILISRKGFTAIMTQGLKGDKEILLSQISAIQFKRVGPIMNGYIQFSFLGGQETKSGILDATKDENTIMFNSSQQPQFEHIKQEIDRRMASVKSGGGTSGHSTSLDELEKLALLKDKGIITEDEFTLKKKQILGI